MIDPDNLYDVILDNMHLLKKYRLLAYSMQSTLQDSQLVPVLSWNWGTETELHIHNPTGYAVLLDKLGIVEDNHSYVY